MEPLTMALIGAGVSAAAQGATSYFGGKAQREAEKRKAIQDALNTGYEMKQAAGKTSLQQQQGALADLIAGYRSLLGK